MCMQRLEKRPISPHVFEIDNPTKFHYAMPVNAISSIANRATGVMLSVGEPSLPVNARARRDCAAASLAVPACRKQHLPPESCCGTAGVTGVGWIALTGDLPGAVAAFKASTPWLVYPVKAAIAGPMVYHYLGGLRHLIWDQQKIGKQAAKTSMLEYSAVVKSSWAVIYASAAGTLALSVLSF